MSVYLISLEPLTKELKRLHVGMDVLAKHPSLLEHNEKLPDIDKKKSSELVCWKFFTHLLANSCTRLMCVYKIVSPNLKGKTMQCQLTRHCKKKKRKKIKPATGCTVFIDYCQDRHATFFVNEVMKHFGLFFHSTIMETFGKIQTAQVVWAKCS